MPDKKISRRTFIVRGVAGGAAVVLGSAYLGRNSIRRKIYDLTDDPAVSLRYMGNTSEPFIWFEVTAENTINFHCPKIEMGQGTFTGLAQIAADELHVALEQINVVHAASATGNIDEFGTGGSTSIAGLWQPLRELSATLRQMLVNKAAIKMGVDAPELQVVNGIISGKKDSLTFGEVIDGEEEWDIPDVPPLKDRKDFSFIGKPLPRVDLWAKVFGETIFGMDAEMPDMLYGAVVRPSRIGATYLGADTSVAKGMPGVVKIVEETDFVGVVATSMMEAENAKNAIKADWSVDRNWETADIESIIRERTGDSMIIQKEGKASRILADKSGIITSEYSSPLGAHAQLEPNGAVAFVEGEKATIMMSTQVVRITRSEVAGRLGLKEENVNIIPTFMGGGFGRRLHTPNAVQAAVMSRAVNKPVKCFFNRKEEFQNDTFRPPTHHIMRAKLDDRGYIQAIEHDYSSGDVMYGSALLPGFMSTVLGTDGGAIRGAMIQYGAIPNIQAVAWRAKLPFATSWWRSLGLLANTFAIESFMDELAENAKEDPVEFRLKHIPSDMAGERLRKVIKAAAGASGYRNTAVGNRAMGFAASTDAGTPVAQVADVTVENNQIRVNKVTCVIDPGLAVNPDQIRAQSEGCIIMGISAAMHERMYVEKGELRPIIYGPYEMAMMRHSPREIEVIILENAETPGAVGEPPLGPIAAAVANAVYRITGKRLRDMPLQLG